MRPHLPSQPTWKQFAALLGVVVALVAFAASTLTDFGNEIDKIQTSQEAARERGFILRAWTGCVDIINDQEIILTDECATPDVAQWYPPDVCVKLALAVKVPECGQAVENNYPQAKSEGAP